MRFDDRLLTVLNQPAGDRHDVAVRWRQLVDLVARAGSNAASPIVIQALESIRADTPKVDEVLRGAAARAVAYLPLPFGLLEYFASGELSVSAPVLAAATLDHGQWQSMLRVADDETRRFIETLHPELRAQPTAELTEQLVENRLEEAAQPAPSVGEEEPSGGAESLDELLERMALLKQAVEHAPAAAVAPDAVQRAPSLHEVVERIEGRRRNRSRSLSTRLTSQAAPGLFRWECGPGGDIAWVDGAPRGALIGRSIAHLRNEGIGADIVRAFALRAPFRDGALNIPGEGAVSGSWKMSGVPAFDPADGRFRGYRGIAMREEPGRAGSEENAVGLVDPASVRELVHEVKTPLNAIVGFAEIIEGQYLGPADRPYRERAEEIVRQARLLLTAIDDVDFVAKMHSADDGVRRTNFATIFEQVIPALVALAESRTVAIEAPRMPRSASARAEPEFVERLILRLGSTVIDQAGPNERLRFTLDRAGTRLRVGMSLPAILSSISEEQLLGDGLDWEQGFSLRLVRRLARMAGADMAVSQGIVAILFPTA